jgi:hypothetical protein
MSNSGPHFSLRWGDSFAYSFTNLNGTLNPQFGQSGVVYYTSPLMCAATVKRPLLWGVRGQFSFNGQSAWKTDTNLWQLQLYIKAGLGQATPNIIKNIEYTPSTGVGTTQGTDPPFQTQFAFFNVDISVPDVPADRLYVQAVILGVEPAALVPNTPYMGTVTAFAAPYYEPPTQDESAAHAAADREVVWMPEGFHEEELRYRR